jgi:small subunit ribosomal protein S20
LVKAKFLYCFPFLMPNTKSAKKALKVSEKKRSRNRRYNELTKESVKALQALLASEKKDAKKIAEALSSVYSRIDTLEKKNILHANTAARRKSLFAKLVKSSNE